MPRSKGKTKKGKSVKGGNTKDVGEEDNVVELSPEEVQEKELREAIEGLREKNSIYRIACLKVVQKYFSHRMVVDFLGDCMKTAVRNLEKCLRNEKELEKVLAAEVIAVTAVQLCVVGEEEALFTQFKPYMRAVLLDVSFSLTVRSKFAQVLGILAFLGTDDVDEILSCMDAFHTVFRDSYKKEDKSVPAVNPAISNLHLNAFSSWGLLLSKCSYEAVEDIAENILPRLPELLTSSNVDLRIRVGETLAFFYEIMRTADEEHVIKRLLNEEELVNDLKGLATDGKKYRAKKDRRKQRCSFRDILGAVEGDFEVECELLFGYDVLTIHTWEIKLQFNAMKDLLGSGLNFHLQKNPVLREILEVGKPPPRRKQASCKARTKERRLLRDKRTGAIDLND